MFPAASCTNPSVFCKTEKDKNYIGPIYHIWNVVMQHCDSMFDNEDLHRQGVIAKLKGNHKNHNTLIRKKIARQERKYLKLTRTHNNK
jgi:hypothetical protein